MRKLVIEAEKINCIEVPVDLIIYNPKSSNLYPYIIVNEEKKIICFKPSPLHGRSIMVDFNPTLDRFIITKGNGLTYFPFGFVSTKELDDYAWGYLRKKDAIRDFRSGEYIKSLGILSNNMEAVFTLKEQTIRLPDYISKIEATILQYNVICPYRISDIPFLSRELVLSFVDRWPELHENIHSEKHCTAAEVLLRNIRLMHENDVLHNAIHSQNYTLSLELLDFELSRTPITPYDNDNDEKTYKKLQKREVIQSLEVVNQIAFFFKEKINSKALQQIMIKNGFENYLQPS
jgi:hypothetical protein